jgi:glycosyltransferase involved in cell wall biosynthesis
VDVIPCYRSENTITTVVEEIKSEMAAKRSGDSYEIVLVNDCSPDNVWSVIERLAQKEKNIYINDSPQYVIKEIKGSITNKPQL